MRNINNIQTQNRVTDKFNLSVVILSYLRKLNHWIGVKFGEQNPYRINGMLKIVDATKEPYKKLICFCSPNLPCHCRTIIPLKKWRGRFRKYGV